MPYEPSPSDAACDLPILSDPVSLTGNDLMRLEKQIFDQDVPTPIREARAKAENSSDTLCEAMELEELYTPLASMDNTPMMPARFKIEDMKVEETLTPPNPTPLAKSVHFNEIIETMHVLASPSPISEVLDTMEFKELFGQAAEQALRRSEQETLVNADTIARVDVPLMDFSVPRAPWVPFREHTDPKKLESLQKAFISEHITADMRVSWRVQKQSSLKWNPFPHNLASVALEENFPHDEELWRQYVADPKDSQIASVGSLTWKPPGLRIINEEEDDDDEIGPGKFHRLKPQDMAFLVKKRKIQIEERKAEHKSSSNIQFDPFHIFPINRPPGLKDSKLEAPSATMNPLSHLPDEAEISGMLGGTFSTGAALENFLEIRGTKKPRLTDSSYFTTTSTKPVPTAVATSIHSQPTSIPYRTSPISIVPLPTPALVGRSTWSNVVISSSLLRNRPLIKLLEKYSPGIRLVERDFTAHNTTIWMPNSVTRSPIASCLASEADIIVSATVGVILTSFQKIKQKPLPGQKTKAAIRDRIEKVCLRYEKLIVLVSEGSTVETTYGLDANDCEALAELIGFTCGLECTILVQIVGGGQETVAKWIASTIVQNYEPSSLLDDETHWEVFLRRAGMNAFAAQTVIAALKAPEGVNSKSPSKAGLFGLTAFVEMGREKRIARFGQTCGTRMMERVCVAIDELWN